MKIKLHIERMVLDGLPVSRSQSRLVQAAVERELARLLAAGGLSPEFQSGGAVAALRAGSLRLEKEHQPGTIGKQIAGALFGGIGGSAKADFHGVPRNQASSGNEARGGSRRAQPQAEGKHGAKPDVSS